MTNEKDSLRSEFTVILTGKDDLVGQCKAAQFCLGLPWVKGDYRVVQAGDDLYAVKYNKKSLRVWPQGKYYGN